MLRPEAHLGRYRFLVLPPKRQARRHVVLTGGCFQNRLLLSITVSKLSAAGYLVYWPQEIPSNDGGLALGQLALATYPKWCSNEKHPGIAAGNKLKAKNFRKVLEKLSSNPICEQNEKLEDFLWAWIGNEHFQTDDICVFGFQINE